MDSPWPMKSHDVFHTGQSSYSTENNNGACLWMFKTIGSMQSGIAIDKDGILSFGDYAWFFYAVYPNGTLKWKYKLFEIIKKEIKNTRDVSVILKSIMNTDLKKYGKEITKIVPLVVKDTSKIPDIVLNQKTELEAIEEKKGLFEKEFKAEIEVVVAEELRSEASGSKESNIPLDSKEAKARNAVPGKPAIILE